MAHLLRSVLYPNGEPSRAAQVGSSSSSNPDLGRRFTTGSSSGGAGVPSAQPNRTTYNNPHVYFSHDPEIEEAAPSGFVADSILSGFDLNNAAPETSSAPESSAAGKFVPGPHSGQTGSATSVAQDYDEEILSQPMVPYVGLTFDDIEEAKELYNNYAYKLGFEKYMLHRWSMAATTPVPDPGSTGGKFGVPVNNTLKYNSLCRKLNSLAADSCIADDTYAIVLDMVDEAKKVVAAMHRARVAGQQGQGEEQGDATDPRSSNVHHEQQQHGSNLNQQQQEQPVAHETPSISNLRNPTRLKPKGRPKEKEQRRKPLVELRDEANKKRKKRAEEPKVMKEPKPKRQARKKKCPFCSEEGHNLKECEYMVLAKQFKDAKDAELEKTV
ncbi:hypothetical protein QYE76_012063 [Lolium multiflorum]|uniref:Uncharacterized protein n=1 Tax=Lolium multiflorum TaxID=4521 RepID=A0AAD8TY53_LOLMU|nr:hypothetical protein QYE76_012063 [Lolium multiflorum]